MENMIATTPPEFLARVTSLNTLGQLLETYPLRRRVYKRCLLILIGLLFIFTAVYLSASQLITLLTAIEIHGRAILLNPSFLLILAGPLLLPFGIFCLIWALRHGHDGIIIFENGMVVQKGKKAHIWHWKNIIQLDSQITHINFGSSTLATRLKVRMRSRDQKKILLRHRYENMEACTHQIREIVLPILYDDGHDLLARQQYLEFGKGIRGNRTGLEFRDRFQAWTNLDNPLIENGVLILTTKPDGDVFFRSKIDSIENLDLLVHLIKNPPITTDQTTL